MTKINGIGASNGIAIAKAYKLVMPDLTVTKTVIEDVESEIKKCDEREAVLRKEIADIQKKLQEIQKQALAQK